MPTLKMNLQSVRVFPAFLLGILLCGTAFAAEAGGQPAETRPIVELPNPVRLAVIPHSFIGPDAEGKPAMVYVVLFQSAGGFCLVQINPADGTSRQWRADDEASNSYRYVISSDGKVYIGSRGTFHRFDPAKPDKSLENLGHPAASEDWMWRIDEGTDGKIYGGTFPGAKLVSYDPATGVLTDHGTMINANVPIHRICTSSFPLQGDSKKVENWQYALVLWDPEAKTAKIVRELPSRTTMWSPWSVSDNVFFC